MDKILFENVLSLKDLHPSMQRRIEGCRLRRGVRGHAATRHPCNHHLEAQMRAERIAEISLETGLVSVSLP